MDFPDAHAHLLHDADSVPHGEGDAFLGGAQQVGAGVAVEIDPVQAASHFAIPQHPFRSVAEGEDANAVRTGGNAGRDGIHFLVAHSFRDDVAAHPGIQDARSVDAEQDTQAGSSGAVIHMRKAVYP